MASRREQRHQLAEAESIGLVAAADVGGVEGSRGLQLAPLPHLHSGTRDEEEPQEEAFPPRPSITVGCTDRARLGVGQSGQRASTASRGRAGRGGTGGRGRRRGPGPCITRLPRRWNSV